MDEKMEEVDEKACIFEESLEIDFDFEFDVAKFYDFSQIEAPEDIIEAERWFDLAEGHAPSPLLAKLENGEDEFPESVTSSPRYEAYTEYSMEDEERQSQNSSIVQMVKGSQIKKPKSKPKTQNNCPASSRLLQPTASHMAKKNQDSGVRSTTRVPTRHQKLGNPLKSSAYTDDTKRQKLEIGYLRKVAELKHHSSFSHKPSKNVGTIDGNSRAKPKATFAKGPVLATSHRGVRQRFNNAPLLGNDANKNGSSSKAMPSNSKVLETQSSFKTKKKLKPPLPQFQDGNVGVGKVASGGGGSECRRTSSNKALQQGKSDQGYNSRDLSFNKKVVSGKGDIGVLQSSKTEANVPRESKVSTSMKMSQNPPTELFSKMSLNPKNDRTSSHEAKAPQQKVLEKNASFSSMNENKNPNAVVGNSMRCSGIESRMIADIVDHLMSARSFTIC